MRVTIGRRRYRFRPRVVALVLALVAWLLVPGLLAARAATGIQEPAVYVVRPGDTLWSLAARFAPDEDPRAWVERALRENGLGSPLIRPGERLRLPGGR